MVLTIALLLLCISTTSIIALEKCPGVSKDSQEDFKLKFDTASIVAYGTAMNVASNNLVTYKVNCTLKGQWNVTTIDFTQSGTEVSSLSECHYMTANKNYIVFVEPLNGKSNLTKEHYRLADMEEIEINENTASNFLNAECDDEDAYGVSMNIFYVNNGDQCGRFSVTCDEKNKASLLQLDYPPLIKSSTFLGGIMAPPKTNFDDDKITGKSGGGMSDETHRHNTASSTTMMTMPLIMLAIGLIMMN